MLFLKDHVEATVSLSLPCHLACLPGLLSKNTCDENSCLFLLVETKIGRKDADPAPNIPLTGLR